MDQFNQSKRNYIVAAAVLSHLTSPEVQDATNDGSVLLFPSRPDPAAICRMAIERMDQMVPPPPTDKRMIVRRAWMSWLVAGFARTPHARTNALGEAVEALALLDDTDLCKQIFRAQLRESSASLHLEYETIVKSDPSLGALVWEQRRAAAKIVELSKVEPKPISIAQAIRIAYERNDEAVTPAITQPDPTTSTVAPKRGLRITVMSATTIIGGSVAASLLLGLSLWKTDDTKQADATRVIDATVQTIADEVDPENNESAGDGAPPEENPTKKKQYIAADTPKPTLESDTNPDKVPLPDPIPSKPLILNVNSKPSPQVPLKPTGQVAEEAWLEALKKAELADGANGLYTATCLKMLATLYMEQERHAEAEPLLRRALKIQLDAFGVEHEETIATDALLQQTVKLRSGKWKAVPGKNGQLFIMRNTEPQ